MVLDNISIMVYTEDDIKESKAYEWIERCETIIKDVQKNAIKVTLKTMFPDEVVYHGEISSSEIREEYKNKLFKLIDNER